MEIDVLNEEIKAAYSFIHLLKQRINDLDHKVQNDAFEKDPSYTATSPIPQASVLLGTIGSR